MDKLEYADDLLNYATTLIALGEVNRNQIKKWIKKMIE